MIVANHAWMTSSSTPSMSPVEIIPTSKGEILHAGGFLYRLKAANPPDDYYEWKCKLFDQCPSTVLSSGGGRNAILHLGHNHAADTDEVEALKLVYRMKKIVSEGTSLPVNKILKKELARMSPGVRSKLSELEKLLNKSNTKGQKSCTKSHRKGGRKTFKQSEKVYRAFLRNFMEDPTFDWYSIDKALSSLYRGKSVRYGAYVDIVKNRKKVEEDMGRLTDDPNALIVSLEEGEKIQLLENQLFYPLDCVSVEMQPVNDTEENTNNADTNEDDIEIIIPPCPAAKPIHLVRQKVMGKSMLIDLTDDSNENKNLEKSVLDSDKVRNNIDEQSDDCIIDMEMKSKKSLSFHSFLEPQDLNACDSAMDKNNPESIDKQLDCIEEIGTQKIKLLTSQKDYEHQNSFDNSTSQTGRRCKSDDSTHSGLKKINVFESQSVNVIHYSTLIDRPVLPLSELKIPLQDFASMDESLMNFQQKHHKRLSSTNNE